MAIVGTVNFSIKSQRFSNQNNYYFTLNPCKIVDYTTNLGVIILFFCTQNLTPLIILKHSTPQNRPQDALSPKKSKR